MSRTRLVALLLVLGTLAIYLPVSHYGFSIFDDNDYVSENFTVQNGLNWGGIQWAFTTFHASNWHPLTWISHELDCQLFGLNAGAHHVVNLLFHAANAALLFILLLRLLNDFWTSAFVAALFAWHPLHVESVAWISERKDVLSTFFALLTLLAYIKYARENSYRSFWLALVFFALALLSKPMAVTLPFLMLLLDWWPLRRIENEGLKTAGSKTTCRKLLTEKIPFFVLAAASCAVTFFAQQHGGMVISLENLPLANRLANVPLAYVDYLLKIVWPSGLTIFYPLPKISISAIVLATLVLIFISGAAWRLRKSQPYLLVGWAWFLGTLAPVIGLVQVGSAIMADRYSYLPSIGIVLMVAIGAADMAKKFHWPKIPVAAAAVLTSSACLFLTHQQLNFWRSDIALFSRAIEITPDSSAMHLSLGLALEDAGRKNEALSEYEAAVKLSPDWSRAHGVLADLFVEIGRDEDAAAEFRKALQLEPDHVPLLDDFGGLLSKLGRFDEAREQFSKAMQLNPSDWRAPFLTGKMLLEENRDAEAVSFFQKALELDPDNIYVLVFFAQVLASDENAKIRDGQTALMLAQRANELAGGIRPDALDALAMADAELGNFAGAKTNAQAARDFTLAFGATNDVPAINRRLALYGDGKPFRQSFVLSSQNDPAR
jgi:protein O-mannosyl-transferase